MKTCKPRKHDRMPASAGMTEWGMAVLDMLIGK